MTRTRIRILPNPDGTPRHFDGTVIRGESSAEAPVFGHLTSTVPNKAGRWPFETAAHGRGELSGEAFVAVDDDGTETIPTAPPPAFVAAVEDIAEARKVRTLEEIPPGQRFVTRADLDALLAAVRKLVEEMPDLDDLVGRIARLERLHADVVAVDSDAAEVAEAADEAGDEGITAMVAPTPIGGRG